MWKSSIIWSELEVMLSLECFKGFHVESRALVLLFIVPVLEVAMGIRLCYELLWVLQLVVESPAFTLWQGSGGA